MAAAAAAAKAGTTYKLSYSTKSNPDGRDNDTNSAARLRTLNDYTPANLRACGGGVQPGFQAQTVKARLCRSFTLDGARIIVHRMWEDAARIVLSRRQLEGGANNVRKKARKATRRSWLTTMCSHLRGRGAASRAQHEEA